MDNQNNKELGLIDIMQIIGKWTVSLIQKLTEWFLFLVFFGIKRWKIFTIVIAIAVIYSAVSFKIQTNQYEASMMVRCNAVEAAQMKTFFDKYSNLLGNDLLPDEYVGEKVGLDSTQRAMFSSISTYFCIDNDRDGVMDEIDFAGKMKSSDDKLDSLNICVKVQFEDVSVLPAVSKSLLNYIENVPYLNQRNEARLSKLEKRKAFLMNEIELLDTLQKKTYVESNIASTLRAQGSHVLVDNRKVLIYQDKVEILDIVEEIEELLEIYNNPITVIDDFVISQTAINSLTSIARSNVIRAMFAAYFLLFALFIYNKVKDQYLK